jgi:uncharacterized protein YaaQ
MNSPNNSPIHLLIAIVQAQDTESASNALQQIEINAIRLPSTGAFLGAKNATLLMQSTQLLKDKIIQALKHTCKQRTEYMSLPVDGTMMTNASFLTPVEIGGATLFTLEVEHFEEV